jgi:hypothetical protein
MGVLEGAAMIDAIRREYDGARVGGALGTVLLWLLLPLPVDIGASSNRRGFERRWAP